MSRPIADPLAGATRLLIDGTNLLHALARTGGPLPAVAVTGRLRALVPPGVAVTLVLDGGPAPGGIRPAPDVRDRGALLRAAARPTRSSATWPPAHPGGALVVTDDIALGGQPARRGSPHRPHLVAGGAPLPAAAGGPGRRPAAAARTRRVRRAPRDGRRRRRAALEARARRDEEDRQPEARPASRLTLGRRTGRRGRDQRPSRSPGGTALPLAACAWHARRTRPRTRASRGGLP